MASLPLPALQRQADLSAALRPPAIAGTATAEPARLSALEWSVIAMAERDALSSIREAGRYTRALRRLLGMRQQNRLANDRLETLRRVAILAWHHGWNVPKSELTAFFEAGFTSDQFELIQNSLGQARAARRRRRAR
jgi:hypothetical protein